jgi:hypothetical protein
VVTTRSIIAAATAWSPNTPPQPLKGLLPDSVTAIAKLLGVSRSPIYKHVPELKPALALRRQLSQLFQSSRRQSMRR